MRRSALALALLGHSLAAFAGSYADVGAMLYGAPGWLQTPVATMPDEGTVSFSLAHELPYRNLSLGMQVFPWLNFAARYTAIDDRPYGRGVDQSYKDKGFDVVLRPISETKWRPGIAIGLLDLAGTGFFSSEYLVATKSIQSFTYSLGIGWGRLGQSGDFDNPAAEIAASLAEPRQGFDGVSEGGTLIADNWFSGPSVGLFGSVAWRSPTRRWAVVAEWDGNTYDNGVGNTRTSNNEPAFDRITSHTRLNFGVRWRMRPGVDLTASYVRGDTLAIGLRFHSNFRSQRIVARQPLPSMYLEPVQRKNNVSQWQDAMWNFNVPPHTIALSSTQAELEVAMEGSGRFLEDGLAAARLTFFAFPALEGVTVNSVRAGMPVGKVVFDREEVEAHNRGDISWVELHDRVDITDAEIPKQDSVPRLQTQSLLKYPTLSTQLTPALRSNIGGLDGFFLTDVQIKPGVRLQLTRNHSVSSTLGIRVFGSLDNVQPRNTSVLPNVRSQLERYQSTSGAAYLETLEWNSFIKGPKPFYFKFAAGILEEMFGGAYFEALYNPFGSRFAVSADIAYVRQRDFDQRFSFLDYSVATGHVTARWRTPYKGVQVDLSAGRYLAKDVGATLRVSRTFASGFAAGVFASKTNVSAEEFGEGSFDKGFFLSIPFSGFDPRATRGAVSLDYRFLTRDGAQKLQINRRLIDEVGFAQPH